MASVNKVTLVGHCGYDPAMKEVQHGDTAIAEVSIATSEKYKDNERTEWHRLVFFGKLAEIVVEYVRKGTLIYVEGKIRSEKYTGKDGIERQSVKIICDKMTMLSSKETTTTQQEIQKGVDAYKKATARSDRMPEPTPIHDLDDDIPF
jgi:single-strand DNA-binding protein